MFYEFYVLPNIVKMINTKRLNERVMEVLRSVEVVVGGHFQKQDSIWQAIHSFVHCLICLTKGPEPLPKWALDRVRSIAPSLKFNYLLFSLRSQSNCWRFLSRLLAPFIFPLITCFIRYFQRKMWLINLVSFFLLYVGYSFFPWLYVMILHFSHDRSK